MKQDIADKWTEALRSGRYSQTDGAMKKRWEDGSCSYCALGVLVDLFKKENHDEVLEDVNEDGTVTYTVDDNAYLTWLPKRVREWADMFSNGGWFNHWGDHVVWESRHRSAYGRVTSVADANDFGLDFDEIADLIDRHRDTM